MESVLNDWTRLLNNNKDRKEMSNTGEKHFQSMLYSRTYRNPGGIPIEWLLFKDTTPSSGSSSSAGLG